MVAARQANARRAAAWLVAATGAVCAVALLTIWMVRAGGGPSAGTAADVPPAAPDIEGRITTAPKWVTPAPGSGTGDTRDPEAPVSSEDGAVSGAARGLLGVVLVEAEQGADRASVTITDRTALLIQRGEETVAATAADLAQGTRVRVWYTGPVAESYPVQAVAGTVLILSPAR